MLDYTISYAQGWPNWYVSEFYKFFHKKLEEKTGTKFKYTEISELEKELNFNDKQSSDSLFSCYSFIILCNRTGKMFVHSWYDYAFATYEWCVRNDLNIVKFSGVSNITSDFLSKHDVVQPSVYCLEYWSDLDLIKEHRLAQKTKTTAYFAGLEHGIREHIMSVLSVNPFFEIYTKSKEGQFKQKPEYYKSLSESLFGLSFNGAANICYRDLELFGLGTLNLRQKLQCVTHNPIIKDVHYVEFLSDELVQKIITHNDMSAEIQNKIDEIKEFAHTKSYDDIIKNGIEWFDENCLPEKQFDILYDMLKDFSIFE